LADRKNLQAASQRFGRQNSSRKNLYGRKPETTHQHHHITPRPRKSTSIIPLVPPGQWWSTRLPTRSPTSRRTSRVCRPCSRPRAPNEFGSTSFGLCKFIVLFTGLPGQPFHCRRVARPSVIALLPDAAARHAIRATDRPKLSATYGLFLHAFCCAFLSVYAVPGASRHGRLPVVPPTRSLAPERRMVASRCSPNY